MTTVPGTFRDLFCAGIDNFKVAWTHYKPRIAPALVLAIAPNLVNSLVELFTIGSSALGGTREMTIADPSAVLYRLVLVVLLPGWIFFFFCWVRFVVHANQDHARTFGIGELFVPDAGFLGPTVLLALAYLGITAVAIIPFGVGLLLLSCLFYLFNFGLNTEFLLIALLFCGAFIFNYFLFPLILSFASASVFALFEPSSTGIVDSFLRGWGLIKKDWKRWFVMSTLIIAAVIALFLGNSVLADMFARTPGLGAFLTSVVVVMVATYLAFVLNRCYRDSLRSILTNEISNS